MYRQDEELKKKKFLKIIKLLGIVFLFLGIGFLALSLYDIANYYRNNNNYIEIKGTVYRYLTNNNDYKAIVVEYEVDDLYYYKNSSHYELIPPKIGTEITVKYNPKNPNDAILGDNHWNYRYPILSLIFIIISVILLYRSIHDYFERKKKKKLLMQEYARKKRRQIALENEKKKKSLESGKVVNKKKQEDIPYDGPPLVVFTKPNSKK